MYRGVFLRFKTKTTLVSAKTTPNITKRSARTLQSNKLDANLMHISLTGTLGTWEISATCDDTSGSRCCPQEISATR